MRWNGRNYRPALGRSRSARPQTQNVGARKMDLVGVIYYGSKSGDEPIPSPTPTPSSTITPTPTITPTITPTPSATPPEQFFILTEGNDNLQAENNDLLILEAAP